MTSTYSFCIHGHFYQPPREDPQTGQIPQEAGAAPYNNWNEKIYHNCYRPNADLGNFGRISFNIGPTLCQWLDEYDPALMQKIVEQERSCYLRHGVGNGMAQAYNHTILPLMPRRDKVTQIRWGIDDFVKRFGHRPEGMWLPETAVDHETLEVMAENGLHFTILAPWQARAVDLDVTQPYRIDLGDGKHIAIFFYEQDLSTRISFDPGSTANADLFASEYIAPKFSGLNGRPRFLMAASDGELYGHHQPFRDKFLNFLLSNSLEKNGLELTYPGLWLRKNPPTKSVEILDETSWSCHHGVLRWSGVCSCTPNSEWKALFRDALVKIAEVLDNEFMQAMDLVVEDVWELRHAYSAVLTGRFTAEEYIRQMLGRDIDRGMIEKTNLLLQAQYERQRMFTSCGWFFEDFDRIEPRNNVAYAAQAVWLTELATGKSYEAAAAQWLQVVKSNRSGLTADTVFRRYLQRARNAQLVQQITGVS